MRFVAALLFLTLPASIDARAEESKAALGEQKVQPDAVIELWAQEWTLADDGVQTFHEIKHVRLLNERAYDEFADPRITYNRDTDKLEILVARTRRADGTYRDLPAYAKTEVAPDATAGWPAFAAVRQVVLVMPAVEPNCIVELEYKITSKPGAREFAADVRLDHRYPVTKRRVAVKGPASGKVHLRLLNTCFRGAGTIEWTNEGCACEPYWVADAPAAEVEYCDLPAAGEEPQAPSWQSAAPRFVFSNQAAADWVRGRTAAINAAADGCDLISKTATECTRDCATASDALRALQQKLAASFSFVNLPAEWRPLKPRRASEVMQSNYGTPEEAAALLLALARAAELSVVPGVLLNEDGVSDLPGAAQVGAYIVGLTPETDDAPPAGFTGDEEFWDPQHGRVQAEGRWGGMTVLPWADPNEPIQFTPWDAPDDSVCFVRGNVKLAEDGTYTGTVSLRITGFFAASESLRTAEAQKSRLGALLARVLPEVSVESHSVRELAAGCFEAEAQVKSAKPLKKLDGGWLLQLPKDGPASLDVPLPSASAGRRLPVRLTAAYDESVDLRVEWPETWKPVVQPAEREPHAEEFDWVVAQSVEVNGRRLRLSRHARIADESMGNRALSPEVFERVRAALNELRTDAARTILLKPAK